MAGSPWIAVMAPRPHGPMASVHPGPLALPSYQTLGLTTEDLLWPTGFQKT